MPAKLSESKHFKELLITHISISLRRTCMRIVKYSFEELEFNLKNG